MSDESAPEELRQTETSDDPTGLNAVVSISQVEMAATSPSHYNEITIRKFDMLA